LCMLVRSLVLGEPAVLSFLGPDFVRSHNLTGILRPLTVTMPGRSTRRRSW
jgi:hypothetical protein